MPGIGEVLATLVHQGRSVFRRIRRKIIRIWRVNAAIPRLLRYNPYTGFIGRKLFHYVPFLLPHDKSYYGFAHLVHPGDGLFLDIGANDGISAIGFKHIHSDYRILSIEPNLCHEPSLRRLKKRMKGFDYRMVGAGSRRGQMNLYVPVYNGVPIYTAASLQKEFVQHTMSCRHLPDAASKHVVILTCEVEILPLDELELRPDIIKIDTEGFDLEVLRGLVKTVDACRPVIMIEHNPSLMNDAEKFFQERRYALFTFDDARDRFLAFDRQRELSVYQEKNITTNIFCIPAERINEREAPFALS